MIIVGLTGGIGSGKSTVSAMLAAKGAVIVDADAITRELQVAGSPLLDALSERFGHGIISADGSLDRPALAAIIFSDKQALADANAIIHPPVIAEMRRRTDEARAGGRIVVMDSPLLAEIPRKGLSGTVVVDLPTEEQVRRLVELRGMAEDDARARIANQATREKRLAIADRVVDNSGTLDELTRLVDEVWEWMQGLPAADESTALPS